MDSTTPMTTTLRRLLTDDAGQDLIEYALLASFLGFTATITIGLLGDALSAAYISWDTAGQSDELVEVPDPQ
jgi:Flp pilus assembly pilin Flp